ncbi:MAG: lytic murein transglycosylase B [gamma proteobacterium symbiont of Bathyaustriella thionipta]|nr:lytic murein transglycosylase B [gamma proteobacterium symbiont of Bathyaustriella thionipta]
MNCRILFLISAIFLLPDSATAGATQPTDFNKKLSEFAHRMANKHGLKLQFLQQQFAKIEYRQDIIDAMNRPAEHKPWHEYRPIFVTAERADGGVEFLKKNRQILQKAEKKWGVPAEIITAIIGVETRYGGFTGRHRVLDALSTLAFAYPKRGAFFEKQLEQFLLLAQEQQIDMQTAKGSYAGAIGMPQFIPGSYRSYAVDFDNDGRIDLWNSKADIIGSVAHYFQRHGWKNGEEIVLPLKGEADIHHFEPVKLKKPDTRIADFRIAGFQLDSSINNKTLAYLVELEQPETKEYWAGLNNFYVITRYNHSNLYAMAVYQLSQLIDAKLPTRSELLDY